MTKFRFRRGGTATGGATTVLPVVVPANSILESVCVSCYLGLDNSAANYPVARWAISPLATFDVSSAAVDGGAILHKVTAWQLTIGSQLADEQMSGWFPNIDWPLGGLSTLNCLLTVGGGSVITAEFTLFFRR